MKTALRFLPSVMLVAVLAAASLGVAFLANPSESNAAGSDRGTRRCDTATSTVALVGHQESRTILPANSLRSWARIQQPANATNTVSLSANGGAAATLSSGLQLTSATSTSPVPFIDLGLNTDFNYVGAVTGITASASSTLLITECVFPA